MRVLDGKYWIFKINGATYFLLNSMKIKIKNYFRPFRGVGAVVAGAGPAHALYFASYEKMKETMTGLFPDRNNSNYGKYFLYIEAFVIQNYSY